MEQKINIEIKNAMIQKDQVKLGALRGLKTALSIKKTSKNGSQELSEAEVMEVIIKQVKQRQDSATIYKEQGREDLFTIEMSELNILQELLPKQLTISEVESVIAKIISETGAASIKDMGKVMGAASKEMAGKTDNKIISEIVKRLLS